MWNRRWRSNSHLLAGSIVNAVSNCVDFVPGSVTALQVFYLGSAFIDVCYLQKGILPEVDGVYENTAGELIIRKKWVGTWSFLGFMQIFGFNWWFGFFTRTHELASEWIQLSRGYRWLTNRCFLLTCFFIFSFLWGCAVILPILCLFTTTMATC